MLDAGEDNLARSASWLLMIVVSIVFLIHGYQTLERSVANPAHDMLRADSAQYERIARQICGLHLGRIGAQPAHRQPLYPMLLAVGVCFGASTAQLGMVSVLALVAWAWLVYGAARSLWGRPLLGAAGACLALLNPTLFESATQRLLTEPLYVLVCTALVWATAHYLAAPRAQTLCLASALAALAYLTRPNGMFLFLAIAAVLAANWLWDAWPHGPGTTNSRSPSARASARVILTCLAIFIVLTVPSWVPRAYHWGNPLYLGYLTNFLWVDTYAEAHLPGPPRYSLTYYLDRHGPGDVASRLAHGHQQTYWAAPTQDASSAALLVLAATGVLLGWRRGDRAVISISFVAWVALLPIVWSLLANPTLRIPYAALLPFLFYFAGSAVDQISPGGAPPRQQLTRPG